ncbi:MAG TPA: fluoride efflux transporter CrcB [Candidatus Polarisedimenticolia bacterium]|nr:fluoride efflux transporter CrcB [Candidatus Polarisedimenticolia bacterium]
MLKTLLVGIGGFLGATGRYLLGGWLNRALPWPSFPYETLVINTTGCLAIGFLGGLADERGALSAEARVFLLIGLLGGYTTFSTFGYETLQLLRDGEVGPAFANTILQVTLGLGGVWAGNVASRMI